MVVVGRDQTRHYYYNCCTILQLTAAADATATRGGGGCSGRRLAGRVSARAPARQNSVAGPPVALPRGRFLNLVGLCRATAADATTAFAPIAFYACVCWAARRMRGRVQYNARGGGGTRYGRWWSDRSAAVDEVQSAMVRGECGATCVSVFVFENPRLAAPHAAHTVQTLGRASAAAVTAPTGFYRDATVAAPRRPTDGRRRQTFGRPPPPGTFGPIIIP